MIARAALNLIVGVLLVGFCLVMLIAAPVIWLAAAVLKQEDRRRA